jgi:hypothetical protein
MEARCISRISARAAPVVRGARLYIRHSAQHEWWFTRRGRWGTDFSEAIYFTSYAEALHYCRTLSLDGQITTVIGDSSSPDHVEVLRTPKSFRACA